MHDAVIVSAARTAAGRAPRGALRATRPDEMAATAIAEAIRRAPGLDPAEIDDVILGCAMPEAEQGLNVARIASLRAGVPVAVSAVTVNRFCSSGLQAIAYGAERIMAGFAATIVAGGTESMSLIPMGGHTVAPNPALVDTYPDVYLTTGLVAENHARESGVSREAQDAFAFRSHQRALAAIWTVTPEDRFLSYLPWHHSFGGIFEKYTALYNGAALHIDDSLGKDLDQLFANWTAVRPTIYFSVPKIYQQLVARVESRPDDERLIFHPGLRFVFTAAAALPAHLAAYFAARRIPVIEGWGLTETSPCCTLTDLVEPRTVQGMVGYPIPGVRVRIAADGEIDVHGPNVMLGYFDEPEATRAALPGDGWFRTGDLGALEGTGLHLISRRDRVFKLANAEKVVPTGIELRLAGMNPYIRHVIVVGSGRDYPAAVVFPDFFRIKEEFGFDRATAERTVKESILGTVLEFNRTHPVRYERIQAIALVSRELTIERNELTPSLKVRVGNVLDGAWEYVDAAYNPNAGCACRFLQKVLRLTPDARPCYAGKDRTLSDCHACGSFIFDDDATARPDILGGSVT